MKKIILLVVLVFGLNVFGQDIKYQAFPITSNGVAATPISIPAPNRTPIVLQVYSAKMSAFSNASSSKIIRCSLLDFKNKELTIRVSHAINSRVNDPIYVGAWFYDKSSTVLDVGYVPKIISTSQLDHTDVILKFNSLPIATDYLEVMLVRNGEYIVKKRFKCAFEWKEAATYHVMEAISIGMITEPIQIGELDLYVPDLEISEVKNAVGKDNSVEYGNTCLAGDKIIFITNRGAKESDTYQLLIGYYKRQGNRSIYVEVARTTKPSLLSGKQTLYTIGFPNDADNIQVSLKFLNGGNGEVNINNNTLSKKCHLLR